MGRPLHYSSEIPVRCQALIEMLGPLVQEQSDPDGKWGGPLKTTFLLAMATPMLVLPIERLFKPAVKGKQGVANDVELDPGLAAHVVEHLGPGRRFGDAPFFRGGAWAYAATEPFEVGKQWPRHALEVLAQAGAKQAAADAGAGEILSAIRNSLAHGGVTYLDAEGGHTLFATSMLGFASHGWSEKKIELRLLRIAVPAFEEFLSLWATWLASSGVADRLGDSGPGYFEHAAEQPVSLM